MFILLGLVVGIMAALLLARRTISREVVSQVGPTKGFGKRDETVKLILKGGTEIETTLGEVERRVKEENGQRLWQEKKFDIVFGAALTVVGIIAGVLTNIYIK